MASAPRKFRPATAIGSTKSEIRNRYAGKAQAAVARWRSSEFSTTITWNMRGRQMIAVADRKVSVTQRGVKIWPATIGSSCITSNRSAGPLVIPQTTKTPIASRAKSLTTASKAMAATTPTWRSFTSMPRVPNRIAKAPSPTANQNPAVTAESPPLA